MLKRIPITPDIHIAAFAGKAITAADYFNKNAVLFKDPESAYITQRPGLTVFEDATALVSDEHGRGAYFWANSINQTYVVNHDTVYQGSYGTACTESAGTFSGGTDKVYFLELADKLIILDPENNKGWTIDVSTPTVLDPIVDATFTAITTTGLAQGGAVLDGYLFVMDVEGNVHHSDLNDPTAWTTGSVLQAQREEDGGIHLDKHHDHIVAFGPRSTEYFYDAGNPTESVLARRQDVFHATGAVESTIWREGDALYGVGVKPSGGLEVFLMTRFDMARISTDTVESFLSQSIQVDGASIVGSGFSTGGRTYYLLTLYAVSTNIDPDLTLVWNGTDWSIWETSVGGLTHFPLVGWTIHTGTTARIGEGIMSNGDLITIDDTFTPIDRLTLEDFVVTDFVDPGFFSDTFLVDQYFPLVLRTGPQDFGTNANKFMHTLEVVGDFPGTAQTATLRIKDNKETSWTDIGTVDLSERDQLFALGSFNRRNIELEGTFTEQVQIEAMEADITRGDF